MAKNLWRDNLISAKENLDAIMRFHVLRRFLEWEMEIARSWSVRPGAHGKGLKKLIAPDRWAELESTYVGANIEDNWAALWRTIALFRKVATGVGDSLGYAYPADLDRRMMIWLRKIETLDRDAPVFNGLGGSGE
jgi:aminoglycoside 6-adenylyltransferase